MCGALEHGRQREAFPAYGESEAVDDFGNTSPADGYFVIFVDFAVAVDVLVADVARARVADLYRRCGDLLRTFEESQCDEPEPLVDLVADGFLPGIGHGAVVFEDLVSVERVVTHDAQRPVPPRIGIADRHFDTFVLDFADVAVGVVDHTEIGRNACAAQVNAFARLFEGVELQVELVVQQAHVQSDVGFVGDLPRYVDGIFVDGRSPVGLVHVLAELVTGVVGVLDRSQVGETASADLAVADTTPCAAQFEVLDHLCGASEEGFVADYPAKSDRRKEAVTVFRGEVLRTVVSEVELPEITVVERVGETSCQAAETVGQRLFGVGGFGIDFVALVKEHHARYGVPAESVAVVDCGFQIDGAVTLCTEAVGQVFGSLAGLLVEQVAVGVASCGVVGVRGFGETVARVVVGVEREHA